MSAWTVGVHRRRAGGGLFHNSASQQRNEALRGIASVDDLKRPGANR